MAGGKLNLEFVDDAYKRINARTSGGKFWRPEKGQNRIRILPFDTKDGETKLMYEVDVHWLGKGKPVRCTGVDCEYCLKAAQLRASGDEAEKERGKRISAKTQYKMLILDRNKPEADQKVLLYDGCATVAKAAIRLVQNPEYGPETHCYKDGRDLTITFDPNAAPADMYTVMPAAHQSDVPDRVLNDIVDLEATDGMLTTDDSPAAPEPAKPEKKKPKKEKKPKEEKEEKRECLGFYDKDEAACTEKCKIAEKCKEETPSE